MSWLRLLMIPLALLYGMVAFLRNKLFDWRILPSESFDVPVISVGNLISGGSGKTPHVEYLIRMLRDRYRIAVLSRGYKRKTKGFYIAREDSSVREVGDEPLQMKQKFPDIIVAVHERRTKGIKALLKDYPDTNLILLDDAFQHRYVKPGLNLLLTEYYHPFFRNFLLPAGTLREPRSGVKRADALIVTKTPGVFSPLDRRFFLKKLCRFRIKKILFSSLKYQILRPLGNTSPATLREKTKTIFLYTGIANPSSIEEHLKMHCQELIVRTFPDHHQFTVSDLKKLRERFNDSMSRSKIIVVTEKDAMRLQHPALTEQLKGLPVYCLPVEVFFHRPDQQQFESLIEDFLLQYPETSPPQKTKARHSEDDTPVT